MWNYLWVRYQRGRDQFRSFLSMKSLLISGTGKLPSLLLMGSLGLALLGFGGVALAAPNPSAGAVPAAQAAGASQGVSGRANTLPSSQLVGSAPTPICQVGDSGNTCARHLTGTLDSAAQAIYQVGVWVAIAVAVLVIIWTTPSAILAAATSNSKVIGQLAARIVIIAALVLLAVNSWTILQFFLGTASQTVTPPTFPDISTPTP
jgi:hypothetical protein